MEAAIEVKRVKEERKMVKKGGEGRKDGPGGKGQMSLTDMMGMGTGNGDGRKAGKKQSGRKGVE